MSKGSMVNRVAHDCSTPGADVVAVIPFGIMTNGCCCCSCCLGVAGLIIKQCETSIVKRLFRELVATDLEKEPT